MPMKTKEVVPNDVDRPTKKKEVLPELVCEPNPTRYSVHLGVKIPSRVEQYRMLDASVTVSSVDKGQALAEAREQFVMAVANLCNTMGETPPDEIRPSIEEIYEEHIVASLYGEDAAQ